VTRALVILALMGVLAVAGFLWFQAEDEGTPSLDKPASTRVQIVLDRARRDRNLAGEKLVKALVALGPKAADEMASRLMTDAAYAHGPALAQAFARLRGDDALPVLKTLTSSKVAAARRTGVAGLGAAGSLDGVVELLADDEKEVSDAVLDALHQLDRARKDLPVRDGMKNTLRQDDNRSSRLRAVEFFVGLGGADGAAAVEECLADHDSAIRAACAEGLGRIGRASVAGRDGLLALLQDGDADVRRLAAATLGKLHERAACPALIEMLGDEDDGLRADALAALRAISGKSFDGDRAAWNAWWEKESPR